MLGVPKEELVILQEQVLYSQVRVRVRDVGGSGTIIYSKPALEKGHFNTYVLTCHHVIESALRVQSEWDAKLGRDRKKEYRQLATVEFFDYLNVPHGRRPVNYSADADIMAYDQTHDMALLRLRTKNQANHVARLLPRERITELTTGTPTRAVGCALGHDPILTKGEITHMGTEIDFKLYFMSSAQTIFGNSGGAVYYETADGMWFIGIPSRISVAGWSAPITHMGYFSPISRVYEFFQEQVYDFLAPNSAATEAECERKRREIREREERKMEVLTNGMEPSKQSGRLR